MTVRPRPPWPIVLLVAFLLFQAWNGFTDPAQVLRDRSVPRAGAIALAACEYTTAVLGLVSAWLLLRRAPAGRWPLRAWGLVLCVQGTVASSLWTPAAQRLTTATVAAAACVAILGPTIFFADRWLTASTAQRP